MRRYLPLLAALPALRLLAADIPIREVILYKSGVGYFERGGSCGRANPRGWISRLRT